MSYETWKLLSDIGVGATLLIAAAVAVIAFLKIWGRPRQINNRLPLGCLVGPLFGLAAWMATAGLLVVGWIDAFPAYRDRDREETARAASERLDARWAQIRGEWTEIVDDSRRLATTLTLSDATLQLVAPTEGGPVVSFSVPIRLTSAGGDCVEIELIGAEAMLGSTWSEMRPDPRPNSNDRLCLSDGTLNWEGEEGDSATFVRARPG